jgi:hypothetical protein
VCWSLTGKGQPCSWFICSTDGRVFRHVHHQLGAGMEHWRGAVPRLWDMHGALIFPLSTRHTSRFIQFEVIKKMIGSSCCVGKWREDVDPISNKGPWAMQQLMVCWITKFTTNTTYQRVLHLSWYWSNRKVRSHLLACLALSILQLSAESYFQVLAILQSSTYISELIVSWLLI